MRKSLWVIPIALLFAAIIGAPVSHAGSITYKVSDTASGIIGNTTFTDALVTVTFVGNTSNVTTLAPGLLGNVVGTGTVTISGIGTFSFVTDEVGAYVAQGEATAVIDEVGGPAILGIENSAFATYGLTTAIGPLTGLSYANVGNFFATTDGLLVFDKVGADSTYTATTATPEPSSLLLFGTSLLGLVPFRRKLFGR